MAENLLKHLLLHRHLLLRRLLPLLHRHLLLKPLLLRLLHLLHLLHLLPLLLLLRPHLLLQSNQASGKQKAGASRLFCFRHPNLR